MCRFIDTLFYLNNWVIMRIGWKQFLKQKMRKASSYHSIGIAFTADQVMLCAFTLQKGQLIWELDASFSHHNWQKSLSEYIEQHHLQGTPSYLALSSHWYRIHQIDKPSVNEDELLNALQWPLRDTIGTDKALVYDYADLPVQVSGQNKVMAVAVAREEIEKFSRAIFEANLNLQSISVEELVTPHLVGNKKEPIITLVQELGEVVVLSIVKNNQLYFTRRITGFENIGEYTEDELEMGITDSLCVQIQRSMDFFESQLRQAPIRQILIKLDSPHTTFLCASIAGAMGLSCMPFEPEISCNHELNFKMASFSCLGAAYTGAMSRIAHQSETGKSKGTRAGADEQSKEVTDEVTN
jgi:MSHA biogenesis protein MshI